MSISLSATIGTMPAIMLSFEKLSIFSIVTNVIVIPIASVAYMFMFVFVIFSLIIHSLGVFIYVFEALMRVVTAISQVTGSISLIGVNKLLTLLFSVSLVSSVIVISDYALIKHKSKLITGLILLFVSIVLLLMMFIC